MFTTFASRLTRNSYVSVFVTSNPRMMAVEDGGVGDRDRERALCELPQGPDPTTRHSRCSPARRPRPQPMSLLVRPGRVLDREAITLPPATAWRTVSCDPGRRALPRGPVSTCRRARP